MPENPDQAIPESDKLHSEDDGGSSQETPQPSLHANGAMGYPHNHIISSQCKEHQATPPLQPLHPFERPQSKAEWIMVWSTVGILIATVVNVWVANSQWQAMKRQADITETQLLASRRPWVGVDISLTADMVASEQGHSVKLKYTTQNYGTTPAVGVYIHPTQVLYTPGVDLDGIQKKVCDLGMNPAVFSMGGHDLFPTQKHETPAAFDLSRSEMDKSFKVYQRTFGNDVPFTSINPFIIGCVTYRSTFDNTIHRTPFSVQLVGIDPEIIGNFMTLKTTVGTIPMKSIFVKPEISIDGIRAD